MLLRFVAGEIKADVELFGAQAESAIGIYDALRSSILDLTADAVVMNESSTAGLKAFATAGKDPKALVEQIALAGTFAGTAVDVFLVDKSKSGEESALFMRLPQGLGMLARDIAQETATFAKDLITEYGFEQSALKVFAGVDQEFDASMLPKRIALAPISIDSIEEDLEEEEAPQIVPSKIVKARKKA